MKRLQLMTLALLLLLLCACATSQSQPPTTAKPQVSQPTKQPQQKDETLRPETMVDVNFQQLVLGDKNMGRLLGVVSGIALILALLEYVSGGRNAGRWVVLMILALLWAMLTDLFSASVAGNLNLTREYIYETVGAKKGLLPNGDLLGLLSGGRTAVDYTVDLICLALKIIHGVLAWAFFLGIIPTVLQNYVGMTLGNKRLQTSILALLGVLAVVRFFIPYALTDATVRLHARRVEVTSNLPLVKELTEAFLNTLTGTVRHTTWDFILTWWGYTFGLLAVACVFAAAVWLFVAPHIEVVTRPLAKAGKRYAGTVSREVQRAKQQAEGGSEGSRTISRREFEKGLREVNEKLDRRSESRETTSSSRSSDNRSLATDTTRAQREEPLPAGWSQGPSGIVVPSRSRGSSPSGNPSAAGVTKPKSGSNETAKRLAGVATGGLAPAVMENPGKGAQTAGTVAMAAGHPEVGLPLAAAGSAVESKRQRNKRVSAVGVAQGPEAQGPERLTEDPKVTQERDALDDALAGFFEGGKGGEA